jgi:hypothetical protein
MTALSSSLVLRVTTARLSWDDLDDQGSAEDGAPDWRSLVVVGPTSVATGGAT